MNDGFNQMMQARKRWVPAEMPMPGGGYPPVDEQPSVPVKWWRRLKPEAMATYSYFGGAKKWDRSDNDLVHWYQGGHSVLAPGHLSPYAHVLQTCAQSLDLDDGQRALAAPSTDGIGVCPEEATVPWQLGSIFICSISSGAD